MEFNLIKLFGKNRAKLNQKKPATKFHFKDYREQLIDALLEGQNISPKDLAFDMLKNLDVKEIIEVMKWVEFRDENFYNNVKQEILNLSCDFDYKKEKYIGFQTKTDENFDLDYNRSEVSLNTGDLIAFLLAKYLESIKSEHEYVNIIYRNIKHKTIFSLKQNIALLESELESQWFLPIDKAIYFFLLYDKNFALEKFKDVIAEDILERRTSLYQMEHFVHLEKFFARLNLDYIPKIETVGNMFGIEINEREKSITKEELRAMVDKGDYFNKKVPLNNYNGKLINPSKDITDYKEVEKLFSAIFKKAYVEKYSEQKYINLNANLGQIFLSNITDPYPLFSESDLILTREVTKELLLDDLSDLKNLLFTCIYLLKNHSILLRWNTLFPSLFSEYLGNPKGFSKDSLKLIFLIDNDKNKYVFDEQNSREFIANSSNLQLHN